MIRGVVSSIKLFICFFLLLALPHLAFSGTLGESADFPEEESRVISPVLVFHEFGRNVLGSITYNYGLNFLGAGASTWASIETGLDWSWRNAAYNSAWLPGAGLPLLFAGYLVPVVTPLAAYLAGIKLSDSRLQIVALGLGQSFLITQTFHIPLKMITGRSVPGIISDVFFEPGSTRDRRTNDFSGEFDWFTLSFYDGWPSGHTACAFSAAAFIAEIYDDRPMLKLGVYAYAVLMGLSVSVNAHWVSDSIAGALYGYAVGKAVGRSYARLLGKNQDKSKVSLYCTLNTIGAVISY